MYLKFRKFIKLNFGDKFLLLIAGMLSLYFGLIVLIFPFKSIVSILGTKAKVLSNELSLPEIQKVKRVEKCISRLSRHFPIKIKCLPKAMAAKYILKRYGLDSTLYIGVSLVKTKSFHAHAWLVCGGIIVSGKEEVGQFKPLVFFS